MSAQQLWIQPVPLLISAFFQMGVIDCKEMTKTCTYDFSGFASLAISKGKKSA